MKIINFQFDVEEIYRHQDLLREMLKSLLAENYHALVDGGAQVAEDVYDEPLLYYYLLESRDHYPIEQIIGGYFGAALPETAAQVSVVSDINQVVYIPEKGYWKVSQQPLTYGQLGMAGQNGQFEERQYAGDTGIEFYQFVPQIIVDFDPTVSCSPKALLAANRTSVECALGHIKNNNPDLFELICLCTKNISLFKSDTLNSFASITHHGTSFINVVAEAPSEVFFIDDLAHQCGHIIFNVLTVKTEDFLNYPKGTLIKEFSGLEIDDRTIYSIFHGLFTYSCILECLDTYLQNGSFGDKLENQREAQARLGFYLIKMFRDLENLYGKNLFTPMGESHYQSFIKNYHYIFDTYYETTKQFKYVQQPYIFCHEQFLKENQP